MEKESLNKQIIHSLNEDGRKSIREVARELDVSPSTVSKHLEQLIERCVIKQFKPSLDYEKLGMDLTAITKIQAKGSKIVEIVDRLIHEDNLTHVYEITGEFDILVIGKFASRESMNNQIKGILNYPAVERADTSIVLSVAKEGTNAKLP